MNDHARRMDGIYHVQRHFYDATRRLFLPGRDLLLERVGDGLEGAVLEVGCGTGRNLRILARRFPHVQFYGVDISSEMLWTAKRKIVRSGLTNIHIAQGDAQTVDPREMFRVERSFDVVFFSYSLSMIPDWRKAMEMGMGCLGERGRLYIIDFWDQQGWPGVVRRLLVWWFGLFHVLYDPGMIEEFKSLAEKNAARFDVYSISGRYAFLATLMR